MKRITLLIYALLVLVMVAATFMERPLSTSWVVEHIYHNPVFILLWILLAVLTVVTLHRLQMWRRLFVWMLHLSFVIILIGAGASFLTSRKGQLHLRMGTSAFRFVEQDTQLMKDMPFALRLDTFWVEYHPDTTCPADYVSWVTCFAKGGKEVFSDGISMNRILKYQGYRFYQSSYDEDGRGSWLFVNYDPWGTPITYGGYFLFIFSMLGTMVSRDGIYRKLLEHPALKQGEMFGRFVGNPVKLYGWLTSLLLLFLLVCVAGYFYRWYIGGRIPLGNGYETMLFFGICVMALAFALRSRFPFAVPFGLLLGGMSQLVPWMMQMDTRITPLAPVLISSWLSVHVSFIMVAYACFAFMALNALLGLFLPREAGRLMLFGCLLLYPAMFFLGAGIFMGAMWANVSWGSYWAWDPKEVWALVTFMVYGVAFHCDSLSGLSRSRYFHLYILMAFLTLLMTYFGVNFLLGGMHSYFS